MAKSRREARQARALFRNPAYALQHAANKVAKGKAKKQARKADRALQTALHQLHMPDAGQRCRREARRWVQAQLETKVITGHIAIELGRFLHDRTTAKKKHSTIEREDLSKGAEEVWARYLEKLARGEADERGLAGNRVEADAIDDQGDGTLGAEDDDEEDDSRILQNLERQCLENEAGALDVQERNNDLVLCHRPRRIEAEEL